MAEGVEKALFAAMTTVFAHGWMLPVTLEWAQNLHVVDLSCKRETPREVPNSISLLSLVPPSCEKRVPVRHPGVCLRVDKSSRRTVTQAHAQVNHGCSGVPLHQGGVPNEIPGPTSTTTRL